MPRVPRATRAELGFVNSVIVGLSGRAAKTPGGLNLFATLGRHRGLFRRWLLFAGALMPRGDLPRQDTELVILRVSHRCDAPYEADYHRPMGRKAGLSEAQVDGAARDELDAAAYSARQLAILHAVDELHDDRRIGDATFAALREAGLGDRDLVELCLLAGHYEMLAATMRSLGIERDRHPGS